MTLSETIEKRTLLEAVKSREKDIRLLRAALKDAMSRIDTDIPGYAEVLAKTQYAEK